MMIQLLLYNSQNYKIKKIRYLYVHSSELIFIAISLIHSEHKPISFKTAISPQCIQDSMFSLSSSSDFGYNTFSKHHDEIISAPLHSVFS